MNRDGTTGPGNGAGHPKATRATMLVGTLRHSILTGELRPGARINLDRLREAHGVSLSPLREAVTRLLPTGLVEFEDHKGYRIAPIGSANLLEVTRLRADFEALALGYAIGNAELDWEGAVLAGLHRLIRTSRSAAPEAWEEAHAAFHLSLAEGCGMPMLVADCRRLNDLTLRYDRILPPSPLGGSGDKDQAAEHAAIAKAAVERDAPEVVRLLRTHIEQNGAALARRLPAKTR